MIIFITNDVILFITWSRTQRHSLHSSVMHISIGWFLQELFPAFSGKSSMFPILVSIYKFSCESDVIFGWKCIVTWGNSSATSDTCTSSAFSIHDGTDFKQRWRILVLWQCFPNCNKIQLKENACRVRWWSVSSTSLHSPRGCLFPLPAAAFNELRNRSVNFHLSPLII